MREYPLRNRKIVWARSGPIWLQPHSELEEAALVADLVTFCRQNTSAVALRLHTKGEHSGAKSTFHSVAYDTTVFVDLDKLEEDILAAMRKRGRRDVRRAQRSDLKVVEVPAAEVISHLDDLYVVMDDTASRDSFIALPQERMRAFLETFVPEGKARLFEATRNDKLVAWAIVVVTGEHAQYYFGASDSTERDGAADLVIWEAMKAVRADGVKMFDMMGIGSDLAPSFLSLNMFKTKFAREIKHVAPSRDHPLNWRYNLMLIERKALRAVREILNKVRD